MPNKRGRKGKSGGGTKESEASSANENAVEKRGAPPPPPTGPQLVLTSSKRRGVYECDYCHSDISQVPRIRCAICPDFDLCLECFVTTDHAAASAVLKAATNAHGAVQEGPAPGISAAAINHLPTHRYKVADSTRYPLFPSARLISKELHASDSMSADGMDGDDEMTTAATPIKTKEIKDEDGADSDKKEEEPDKGVESKENDDDTKAAEEKVGSPVKSEPPSGSETMTSTVKDDSHVKSEALSGAQAAEQTEVTFILQDDPKTVWTVEEDLRLLDAISTCGLGNWADISEAIGGSGSSSKTPKRCMERYFDDFLGRYGHILPAYTVIDDEEDQEDGETDEGDGENEPKRRRVERMSSFGVSAQTGGRRGKKKTVVLTSSLPENEDVWPSAYLPPIPNVQVGQDVGRDHQYRAEQVYVKLISSASSKEEVEKIRKEWEETRLNKPNGPTALPMRVEDLPDIPGSELAGFMPRRGDFDMEWENEAENILADMEFSPNDSAQDRELKVQVIQIYNAKLDERDRRKQYLLNRNMLDYRKNQEAESKLPRDERDLVRRMRLFERFHTPEEHQQFISDILKAKRLRKEIALLQMYRRIGIRSLAEAEQYDNDKKRREIHKFSHLHGLEVEAEKQESSRTPSSTTSNMPSINDDDVSGSLWKQYRTSDRKNRRSINRTSVDASANVGVMPAPDASKDIKSPIMQGAEGKGPENEQSGEKPSVGEAVPHDEEKKGDGLLSEKMDKKESEEETAKKDDQPADMMDVDKPDESTTGDAEGEKDNTISGTEKESSGDKPVAMDVDEKSPGKEKPATTDGKKETTEEPKQEEIEEGTFKIVGLQDYELLTTKEADLCRKLKLKPTQYLKVKKAIILESFKLGMLNKEGASARNIMTIDVEKKGNIVDFMVRSGWISSKLSV